MVEQKGSEYAMNVNIKGYNIHYKITGDGDDIVVILQGWGTSLGVYDMVADTINGKYRVVQFDFPGFGASDEPREAWNVDAFADFFCEFMSILGIKKAALIGHSYGGRVIIKLATRESLPFEIVNIVLIDSAGILPKRTIVQKAKIKRFKILKKVLNLKIIYVLFSEIIDDWRGRQGSDDYKNATPIMRQCMVMAVNEDLTKLLPKIKQDTLLIWGDKDTATPIGDAKVMEKKIPDSGLVVLKGAGHFSFLDQPNHFRNIMQSYFKVGV